jgi:hypothetical protein
MKADFIRVQLLICQHWFQRKSLPQKQFSAKAVWLLSKL